MSRLLRMRRPWALGLLGLALVALALVAAAGLSGFGLAGQVEARTALAGRGRIAVVSGAGAELPRVSPEGTELVAASAVAGLAEALAGDDGRAVARALEAARVTGLWLAPAAAAPSKQPLGSVEQRLVTLAHVDGLRGLYLSRRIALYGPDPMGALSDLDRKALAGVARGLVGGAKTPRLSSFPESLRRVQPVEVMVLLLEDDKPRLWRSARGSSLARALVTAATVARQRWIEREQAMGAAIDAILPMLRVEVALLGDDGTLGERDAAFIDRALGPEHGVGYENKGAWRYLLPEATRERGRGKPSVAYRALMQDDGLPPESLDRADLRLYRVVVTTLAVSDPAQADLDSLSVGSPDELLAP